METLDYSGIQPLYYQIYNILFQDITNGKYKIGDMIPAESSLVNTYHISRATARKAVELLANEGFVEKKRGDGTKVISSHPKNSPQRVVKYSRKQKTDRVTATKRTISQEIIAASKEMAEKLQIQTGSDLIKLKRVRYAEEEPMYIETVYMEQAYVPEAINQDYTGQSLRVFLQNTYNIQWSYANQKIYAVSADKEKADLLNVPLESPLIHIKRISFDAQSVPREYVSTYYRGDMYHLEIELAI